MIKEINYLPESIQALSSKVSKYYTEYCSEKKIHFSSNASQVDIEILINGKTKEIKCDLLQYSFLNLFETKCMYSEVEILEILMIERSQLQYLCNFWTEQGIISNKTINETPYWISNKTSICVSY